MMITCKHVVIVVIIDPPLSAFLPRIPHNERWACLYSQPALCIERSAPPHKRPSNFPSEVPHDGKHVSLWRRIDVCI